MQRAYIPYRNWLPSTTITTTASSSFATSSGDSTICESHPGETNTRVAKLVSENAIIVIARSGCCMCHVLKHLLLGLAVNPTIFEVNKEDEEDVEKELSRIVVGELEGNYGGGKTQFPVVFVGGKLFGGLERVMATHISGELVPKLKQAGALWL